MKTIKQLFVLFILITLSVNAQDKSKGNLFIIGGGNREDAVMERFVKLAGGTDSKIVIIPIASGYPMEAVELHTTQMKRIGCKHIDFLIFDRATADDPENLKKLEGVKGIFFGGGDQNILSKALLGTKLLDLIKNVYYSGGVVGGTSAGAAVMSEIMITGDELINKDSSRSFITIQKNNVQTAEGFGFVKNGIIDQHFIIRKRANRLISVLLEHPALLGIGIDEQTVAIIRPDNKLEAYGESTIMIFDAAKAKNIKTNSDGLLSASDIKMHILQSGQIFDFKKRAVIK
ncbi:MAG: cyanophycinase [Melioribacteraceae bacterium]|nr:cyanophycinase [Melioribacteraceae bacterium]